MSFVSLHFAIFFPAVATTFFLVPNRQRWLVLLVASLYFYASWMPIFLLLPVLLAGAAYVLAFAINSAGSDRDRRIWLTISLIILFAPLIFFKYVDFLNRELGRLVYQDSRQALFGELGVMLPIGISFFTFQVVSYIIDVYRQARPVERQFGTLLLYKCFFPQLVAGPIERSTHLLYEMEDLRNPAKSKSFDFDADRVVSGLRLVLWGVFKKLVIADNLALVVNAVYSNPSEHHGTMLLVATYCFAYQIYCDFSGYTDIARGTARVFGIELVINFSRPYQALSIQEFWRRWHISLTSWFRDYVYYPMGGNRVGFAHWMLNVMVVFLLSGIWHGANWTFLVWGAIHGAAYVLAMMTLPARAAVARFFRLDLLPQLVRGLVCWAVTFHIVILSWVFFRSNTIADALMIVQRIATEVPDEVTRLTSLMLSPQGLQLASAAAALDMSPNQLEAIWNGGLLLVVCSIVILEGADWLGSRDRRPVSFEGLPGWTRWAAYYILAFAIWIGTPFGSQQFIYFQF